MPQGILFDHAGMSAVSLAPDSVLSELYEHIGCRIVIPLFITTGVNVWVDAEGEANGQSINEDLSKVADILGGFDYPIYGPGVFLGCAKRGESEPALDLTRDNHEAIVMAQVRSTRRQLRDPLALNR